MRDEHKRLRALPARPTDEVLAALASVSADAGKSSEGLPVVTLHLASGRDLTGCVVALGDRRGTTVVVMQTGSSGRHDAGSDATYVALGSIAAVTVHDAASIAEALAGGALHTNEPPPTRLAARRSVLEDSGRLSNALGTQIVYRVDIDGTADGEPMRSLTEASRRTCSVLIAVAGDDMGRQALAQVREVAVEVGGIANARRNGGTLLVTADNRVDPAELLKVIEAAL